MKLDLSRLHERDRTHVEDQIETAKNPLRNKLVLAVTSGAATVADVAKEMTTTGLSLGRVLRDRDHEIDLPASPIEPKDAREDMAKMNLLIETTLLKAALAGAFHKGKLGDAFDACFEQAVGFGYAVENKVMGNHDVERILNEMKDAETITDEQVTDLSTALTNIKPEQSIYYLRRALVTMKLPIQSNAAFQRLMLRYRDILI